MKPLLFALVWLAFGACDASKEKTEERPMQRPAEDLALDQSAPSAVEAPATPQMPADWRVVKDENFSPADIEPVDCELGWQGVSAAEYHL